ncbi:MAG: hypothetical protein MJ237_02650 [bacterium]|nr:hypothetical protein [bacterium]
MQPISTIKFTDCVSGKSVKVARKYVPLLNKTTQELALASQIRTSDGQYICEKTQQDLIQNYLERKTKQKDIARTIFNAAVMIYNNALNVMINATKKGLNLYDLRQISDNILLNAIKRNECYDEIEKIYNDAVKAGQTEYTLEQDQAINELNRKAEEYDNERIKNVKTYNIAKQYNKDIVKQLGIDEEYSLFYEYQPELTFPDKGFLP